MRIYHSSPRIADFSCGEGAGLVVGNGPPGVDKSAGTGGRSRRRYFVFQLHECGVAFVRLECDRQLPPVVLGKLGPYLARYSAGTRRRMASRLSACSSQVAPVLLPLSNPYLVSVLGAMIKQRQPMRLTLFVAVSQIGEDRGLVLRTVRTDTCGPVAQLIYGAPPLVRPSSAAARASPSAIARPMPRLPPHTTARLPLKSKAMTSPHLVATSASHGGR